MNNFKSKHLKHWRCRFQEDISSFLNAYNVYDGRLNDKRISQSYKDTPNPTCVTAMTTTRVTHRASILAVIGIQLVTSSVIITDDTIILPGIIITNGTAVLPGIIIDDFQV